ncbi:MAG: Hpt domain-containing protein [Verrucomicrobiota bacterium]
MDSDDTIDWDSDPELKSLLDHFIGTFAERRVKLAALIEGFERGQVVVEALKGLQFEAHKVAGAAATFGFPLLSELGLELDEFLKSDLVADKGLLPVEWAQMARFLDELLAEVQLKRRDPLGFLGDPRRKIWTA